MGNIFQKNLFVSAKQANEAFNDHKTMQTKPKYTKK